MKNGGGPAVGQNLGNKIYRVPTSDNCFNSRGSATTLLNERFDSPTIIIKRVGKIYVLNAKLNKLNDPTAPPEKQFSIQLVRWVAQY